MSGVQCGDAREGYVGPLSIPHLISYFIVFLRGAVQIDADVGAVAAVRNRHKYYLAL